MPGQLPNILPPLPQQIHLKSKMDSLKGKSQLVETSNSKLSHNSLGKRGGGVSSQSATNIQNQMMMPMDRNSFIIMEAPNEKSETQYTMIDESRHIENTASKPQLSKQNTQH